MNGDCSSATASATFNAPSNTGSPVVFMKSASRMVSCSVNVPALRRPNGLRSTSPTITAARTAAATIQER